MCSTVLCAAAILVGVKFGFQPLPDGGVEYIIQIEPLAVESLRAGVDIHSDVPPALRDVRSFRVTARTDLALAGQPQPESGAAGSQKSVAPALPAESPASFGPQPDSAIPRGTMFPTTPPGSLPLPKVNVGGDPPGSRDAFDRTKGLPSKDPGLFPPSKDVKPLAEEKASFLDPGKTAPSVDTKQPAEQKKTPVVTAAASEPELPKASPALLLSLAATTVGSLGGMMFFGWVAWDYRNRYRRLLRTAGRREPAE